MRKKALKCSAFSLNAKYKGVATIGALRIKTVTLEFYTQKRCQSHWMATKRFL